MLTHQDIVDLINELDFDVESESIAHDATLKSIGIDSLDMFTLLVEIETRTGRKIPDEEVEGLETINDIVEYFA